MKAVAGEVMDIMTEIEKNKNIRASTEWMDGWEEYEDLPERWKDFLELKDSKDDGLKSDETLPEGWKGLLDQSDPHCPFSNKVTHVPPPPPPLISVITTNTMCPSPRCIRGETWVYLT